MTQQAEKDYDKEQTNQEHRLATSNSVHPLTKKPNRPTMTSSVAIMPSSTSPQSPLTLRRCTTITRPDHQQGLIIEYTLINNPVSPVPAETQNNTPPCETKLPPLVGAEPTAITATNSYIRRQRPWLGLATSNTYVDKKRRLERMNLRGENRTFSRTSNSQRTSSSCKRSDSTTNDSQKSVLTPNSLEDRLSEDRVKHITQVETIEPKEELTEEKLEQRRNFEKCMNWIEKLPSKFSGMHIAQERAPVMKD